MPYRVAPCGEFPNDNPSLHAGAIWLCAEPCANASCELAVPDAPLEPVVTANEPAVTDRLAVYEVASELEEDVATVEVVEDLEFDDHAFDEPNPVASLEDDVLEVTAEGEHPETTTEDTPPDAFESFARVLEDVALASGADARAVGCLRALLGRARLDGIALDEPLTEALVAGALVVRTDRGPVRAPGLTSIVLAWQGILRGESEDFGPCGGATLDEWSANLVARVLGLATRTEGIRRELRRRGVAAFGFLADAA
jgi:hypothetical protein